MHIEIWHSYVTHCYILDDCKQCALNKAVRVVGHPVFGGMSMYLVLIQSEAPPQLPRFKVTSLLTSSCSMLLTSLQECEFAWRRSVICVMLHRVWHDRIPKYHRFYLTIFRFPLLPFRVLGCNMRTLIDLFSYFIVNKPPSLTPAHSQCFCLFLCQSLYYYQRPKDHMPAYPANKCLGRQCVVFLRIIDAQDRSARGWGEISVWWGDVDAPCLTANDPRP